MGQGWVVRAFGLISHCNISCCCNIQPVEDCPRLVEEQGQRWGTWAKRYLQAAEEEEQWSRAGAGCRPGEAQENTPWAGKLWRCETPDSIRE